MNSIYYILKCTARNFLKNLIRKPLTLVMYILFIGILSLNSIIVLFTNKSGKAASFGLEYYLYGTLALILISVIPSLYQSISRFALNLRMADVNFLMTAPMKPSKILLYAQIKTSITMLLISLFMMIQIPLMVGTFGMKPSSIPIFIFAWFLMLISSSPICLAVFVLIFKYPLLKPLLKSALILYCGILILYAGSTIFSNSDFILGLKDVVWKDGLSYFPLVGWYFEVFKAAVAGTSWLLYVNIGLIFLTTSAAFVVIFKLVNTDFYEDAIKTSETMDTLRKAAKEGKSYSRAAFGLKDKKIKKVNDGFTKQGALAIFQKQLLELRKTGIYFFNLKTVLILLLDCLLAYFVPIEKEIGLSIKLLVALAANMYILLLSSNISSITRELDKPFIYLMPVNNFKKLFALTSINAIKNFTDSLLPMLMISIYFKASILDTLLAALCMMMLSYTFNFLDLVASMLFGRLESAGLKAFFKVMLNMLMLLPSIIIIAVLINLGYGITLGFAFMLLTIILLGGILMLPAAFSLKNPELNA